MKKFLPLQLTQEDQQQLDCILQQITQIRISINLQFDNLEQKVYEKLESLLHNPLYQNLQSMETVFLHDQVRDFNSQLTEIIREVAQFSLIQDNQIKHKNEENLQLLNFSPALRKLNEIQSSFKYAINNILCIIEKNKPVVKQEKQAMANTNLEIWKHKTFAKTERRFVAFNFQKNQGTAESFLPLVNLVLKGVFLTQLFQGQNQFDQDINDQKKEVIFWMRIHEGINLSIYIHDQILKITHNKQKIINDCYFIELKEQIYLRQGLVYTISLISNTEENFNTFMFSGKSVSFGEIKFLNKETENIAQAVCVKQNSTQSCISGLAFAK